MQEFQEVPPEDQQAGDGHVLVRQKLHVGVDGVPGLQDDPAHALALGYGGLYGFGGVGNDPVDVGDGVHVHGQEPLDLLGGVDLYRVLLLGELHVDFAHQLVSAQKDLPLIAVEAQVKEALRLGEALGDDGAVLLRDPLRAQHHAQKAPVAPGGGGHQAVAGVLGVAGLDALGPLVEVVVGLVAGDQVVGGEQLPGLGEVGGGDLVVDGAHDGHEVGVGPGGLGNEPQVPGGGVMVGVGQAVGVAEMGALTAQVLGLLVHPRHEGVDRPVDGLRQHVAALVGGGEHDAVEQLLHRQLLARLDAHVAAVGRDGGDGGFGGGEDGVHGQLALVDGLQHQKTGEDLCYAGGVELLVDVLRVEDFLGVRVDEKGGLGLDVEGGLFLLLRRGGGGVRLLAAGGGQGGG